MYCWFLCWLTCLVLVYAWVRLRTELTNIEGAKKHGTALSGSGSNKLDPGNQQDNRIIFVQYLCYNYKKIDNEKTRSYGWSLSNQNRWWLPTYQYFRIKNKQSTKKCRVPKIRRQTNKRKLSFAYPPGITFKKFFTKF